MDGNGRSGLRVWETTAQDEMRAFDRLPPAVRHAMHDIAIPIACSPNLSRALRILGARALAEDMKFRFPCGGIQGERIPLAPEDAEWLARATRTNHPATAEGGER